MSDNDVEVKFGASLSDLQASVNEAKSNLSGFAEHAKAQADGIKESFTRLAEAVGVAFTIDSFKNWVEGEAELGEQTERTAAKLGITAQQASELSGMAVLTGTSFEGLERAFERLQPQLAQAETGSGRVAAALNALGISAKEFAALPIPQQIERAAEAFSHFADGPTKTAAAMALLGRAGAEMLPFLDRGKEGIEELGTIMSRTGAVMTNEMAASFAGTKEDLNEMSLAWQGLSNKFFDVANGPIDAVIRKITSLIESLKESDIRAGVELLANDAIDIAAAVAQFAVETKVHWDALIDDILAAPRAIGDAFAAVGGTLASVRAAINSVTHGDDDLRAAFPASAFGGIDAAAEKFAFQLQAIDDAAKKAKASVAAALSGSTGANPYGDLSGATFPGVGKPQVKSLDMGADTAAKQQTEATQTALNEEIKAYQDAAKQEEKALDDKLSHHQISDSEWLSQSLAALQKELTETTAVYQQELAQAGLTSEQKAQIKEREADAIRAINNQIVADERKAADETTKAYQDAGNEILSAWNSNLRGLLSGTESFHTAFLHTLGDLVIKWIEAVEKLVVQWVAGEAAKTAATNAGAAARTASGAGEASAGIAMDAMTAIKSIITSAAEAFAGVFGFLAPVLGPGAAGPAAAAEGMVLGKAGAVTSADIGMWQVPGDQMAMIHRNELIMPAAQAGAFRDMLSGAAATGGGASVSANVAPQFHVHAMDAQTVASTLMGNRAAIVKAVGQAVRDGAHHGVRGLRFA